jgi:hypothetical protein
MIYQTYNMTQWRAMEAMVVSATGTNFRAIVALTQRQRTTNEMHTFGPYSIFMTFVSLPLLVAAGYVCTVQCRLVRTTLESAKQGTFQKCSTVQSNEVK